MFSQSKNKSLCNCFDGVLKYLKFVKLFSLLKISALNHLFKLNVNIFLFIANLCVLA